MDPRNVFFYLRSREKKNQKKVVTFDDVKGQFPDTPDDEIRAALDEIIRKTTGTIQKLALQANKRLDKTDEKSGTCETALTGKERITLLPKIINVIKEWPDDWPTNDEILQKLKELKVDVAAETIKGLLSSFLATEEFKRLDEHFKIRVRRASMLGQDTKSVLFAIRGGCGSKKKIASEVGSLSQSISFYIGALNNLAVVDFEVKKILKAGRFFTVKKFVAVPVLKEKILELLKNELKCEWPTRDDIQARFPAVSESAIYKVLAKICKETTDQVFKIHVFRAMSFRNEERLVLNAILDDRKTWSAIGLHITKNGGRCYRSLKTIVDHLKELSKVDAELRGILSEKGFLEKKATNTDLVISFLKGYKTDQPTFDDVKAAFPSQVPETLYNTLTQIYNSTSDKNLKLRAFRAKYLNKEKLAVLNAIKTGCKFWGGDMGRYAKIRKVRLFKRPQTILDELNKLAKSDPDIRQILKEHGFLKVKC